jgi:peroxin-3
MNYMIIMKLIQLSRIKNHFTSLLSTISYTIYALLPTLQPQLEAHFPVEATSQALQGLSASNTSSDTGSTSQTPDNSLLLHEHHNPNPDQSPQERDAGPGEGGLSSNSHRGVGESWASEFQSGHSGSETDASNGESFVDSSIQEVETDDTVSFLLDRF